MRRRSHRRALILALLISGPSLIAAESAHAQEWRPMLKARWGDQDTWQIITPRDLDVDPGMFSGLRAQYEVREGATDPLIQDGLFQFQPAFRNGARVLLVSYFTLGHPDDPELAPGWWNGVVEPRSLTMLDFLSWNRRFGAFMYLPSESGTTRWRLAAGQDEWSDPTPIALDGPVFSLSIWGHILAALDLHEGMKFRLAVLQGAADGYQPHYVAGRTTVADLDGRRHDVWAVETPEGRSGWVTTYYVDDEAPFYFGLDVKNVETGQIRRSWRLRRFERLGMR